jgi:hypothetical protein
MAQTKKKRRKRHAGTQAGTVERRGRTSKPAPKPDSKTAARERRAARFDQPPSWRSAITRAAVSAAIFGVLIVLAFGQSPARGALLGATMFVVYIPMAYLMDRFLYNRRQKQKAREAQAPRSG